LKGPADRLLVELGGEASSLGVATHLRDVVASIVIDDVDAELAGAISALGMRVAVTETVMRTPEISAKLANAVLDAGRRGVHA
jgi:LPPG:FO 2-phospho-L-lactate transferase